MKPTPLLIVDDESGQRSLLAGFLARKGYAVIEAENGTQALEKYRTSYAPAAIIDMKMPGMSGLELLAHLREFNPFIQVIVLTAFGSVETAVAAMRAGAYDYLTKPVEDLEELLLKIEKGISQNRLVTEHAVMRERLAEIFPNTSELIGDSPAIHKVKELIGVVGPRESTVLVTGPSGSGKELVARAVHALSPRAGHPMVIINCAAFPETLLEAELFGYEKGAFTGADRAKPGRFELAQGGTLFLDEIGEMPLSMQVKLLRVIEDRKLLRLGAVKEIALDFRLIAATNRPLEQAVAERKFREDLFYRLNVIRIQIPPLAERKGDILILAKTFLERASRKLGRDIHRIDPGGTALLTSYAWPGNVRELENVIERAVLLAESNEITSKELGGLSASISGEEPAPDPILTLAELEKVHIKRCLDALQWNLGATADRLGIHRNTLRLKIKEYEITES
jgi:two-component system, NtrC family, response regulator HydG